MFEQRPTSDRSMESIRPHPVLDDTFDTAFRQLVAAWEHHHDLRGSSDLSGRMSARLHLDRERRRIAAHRRQLAA